MKSDHDELNQIRKDLDDGKTATPVIIREFLSWFDVQRRTAANVGYINDQLNMAGLRTVPDYLNIWVGTPIAFELVSDHIDSTSVRTSLSNENIDVQSDVTLINEGSVDDIADPSFKIGRIKSARTKLSIVKQNSTLSEAITVMMANNFSQIPVMTTEYVVKGMISWESIGSRLVMNIDRDDVQSYMDPHYEISVSASLFSAIRVIVDHNYVLVRDVDNKISGIVTSSDIALQFEEISTPFLLLAEIENNLRAFINKKLSLEDIRRACSDEYLPEGFSSVAELSFGNYVRILESPDNWKKCGLKMERASFCRELQDINSIRNDVMHFDPDPLSDDNLSKLRNVARMFDLLRVLGAF